MTPWIASVSIAAPMEVQTLCHFSVPSRPLAMLLLKELTAVLSVPVIVVAMFLA
jgi:hypothetical protein